ncbi:MAG: dCTP deaminase [Candidatus Levyibacteriota bacterium]
MVLSDRDLKQALKSGKIKITPAPDLETQLGSCSIDLRLGDTFRIFESGVHGVIDPQKNAGREFTKEVVVKERTAFIMQPGDFVLATTVEELEVPDDLLGNLEGRSSIGRLGIIIHSTAASIDPGMRGHITLELANMGKLPVALYPGMRICSISFEQLSSPAEVPYYKKKSAKYLGQVGPGESKIDQEL